MEKKAFKTFTIRVDNDLRKVVDIKEIVAIDSKIIVSLFKFFPIKSSISCIVLAKFNIICKVRTSEI